MASAPIRPSPQPLTTHNGSSGPVPMDVESPTMLSPDASPPTSPVAGRNKFRSYSRNISETVVRRLRSRSPNPRAATMDSSGHVGHGAHNAHDTSMGPPASTMLGPDRTVQSPGAMSPPPVSGIFPATHGSGRAADPNMPHAHRSVSTPANAASSSTMQPKEPKGPRTSGTFTDCGRHSNEWLFGGFSVREATSRALTHLTQGERRNS